MRFKRFFIRALLRKALGVIALSLFICLAMVQPTLAADEPSGTTAHRFSIIVSGSGNRPVSASMKESTSNFFQEVIATYNNSAYPFAPTELHSAYGFGFQMNYTLDNEHLDAFVAAGTNRFDTRAGWSPPLYEWSYSGEAMLNMLNLSLGIETSMWNRESTVNVFGRAAIMASTVGGTINFQSHEAYFPEYNNSQSINIPSVGRLGGTIELGLRYHIPSTAFALELSAAYANVNLFGKSYTKLNATPPDQVDTLELNDGKNPDDPNDKARTIDFASLKLGLRWWIW